MSTFTIESVSTDGVDQPPNVEFVMAEHSRSFSATPDGARIEVFAEPTPEGQTGRWSRIILIDTVRGFIAAEILVHHHEVPGHPQWEDPALYAGETACALYWSMWRMQQVNARKAAQDA